MPFSHSRTRVQTKHFAEDAAEVKDYTFFNPRLRYASYAMGDIYSKKEVAAAQDSWAIPE